jgi:antitoxin ParD1/3/4
MARNTSILLGEHFEEFISTKISSGKYNSASEVIRTALRLLEAEDIKLKNLNKALSQGEKSGVEKNFNQKAHLKKLHSKLL